MEITCAYCQEEILPPELLEVTGGDERQMHRECWTRIIAGSVAHQRGTCVCGLDDDCECGEENLTRRENARRAARVFVKRSKEAARGHWEAVPDDPHPDDQMKGRFWRVRWSKPTAGGKYLYVKHYGGNGTLNEVMAKNDAERMNEKGRHPSEWR